MGFNVLFGDLRSVNEFTSEKITSWNDSMADVQSGIKKVVELEDFQGKAATSVKAYYSEVHTLMMSAVATALSDFMVKYLLYITDYYDIDKDKYAHLNEDTMTMAISEYETSLENLDTVQSDLSDALDAVSDIFYVGVPGTASLITGHEDAKTEITNAINKVQPLEDLYLNNAIKQLEELIANTRAYIAEYKNADRNIAATYVSGDYLYDENIYALAVSMEASAEFNKENEQALKNAIDQQQKVYQEIQKEYEAELAAERADRGVAQILVGGAAVILGGAAIILTAGAATPVVVTAAVAGGSTIIYGTAEIIEGGQHTYYGLNGDPYTSAFNPVRDTVFGGDQSAYSTWGKISMTVASMCIPVAKTTQGLNGIRAVKAGGIAVAKEGAEEVVENYVIEPYITNPISDKIASATGLDDSATGSLIIDVATDAAVGGIIDNTAGKYVDDKLDYEHAKIESEQIKVDAAEKGGFAGLMDEADADRYTSGKQNDLEIETNEIRRDANASDKGLSGLMDENDAKRYDEKMNSGEKPQKIINIEEQEAETLKKAEVEKFKEKLKEKIPKAAGTVTDNDPKEKRDEK